MEQVQAVEIEDGGDGPATADEMNEYRRLRPLLLQMVEDWQKLKGPAGCPAMWHILRPK